MKLNSKNQLILAVVIFIGFYLIAMITKQRAFRGLGMILSGLLYAINPVVSEADAETPGLKKYVRIAGIILMLAGIFT